MNIYKKFDSSFKGQNAWALVDEKTGEQIGLIATKYTAAGVLHAYVHEFGVTMVHGQAGGFGYDKVTAAFQCLKVTGEKSKHNLYAILKNTPDNGEWKTHLKDHGIAVLRAM